MPQPSSSRERREAALQEVGKCVLQDRNASYGDPEDNFQDIADRWTIFFRGRFGGAVQFSALDVAIMMADVKMARLRTSPCKLDNHIDLAGYAVCAAGIVGADAATETWVSKDASESQDDPHTFRFRAGDKVRHEHYGEGCVVRESVTGRVVVDFPSYRAGYMPVYTGSLTFVSRPGEQTAPTPFTLERGDVVHNAIYGSGIVQKRTPQGTLAVAFGPQGHRHLCHDGEVTFVFRPEGNVEPPESKTA